MCVLTEILTLETSQQENPPIRSNLGVQKQGATIAVFTVLYYCWCAVLPSKNWRAMVWECRNTTCQVMRTGGSIDGQPRLLQL